MEYRKLPSRNKNKRKYDESLAFMDRTRKPADNAGEDRAESFECRECGVLVQAEGAGSEHRNHCPKCLCSVHLDVKPGDRASYCKGVMDAIGVWVRKDGEWALIHRCRVCGALSSNRIAADDNPVLLMSIAVKPLANPPFPLSRLGAGS
jgi:ribosome biogenesis GTPase